MQCIIRALPLQFTGGNGVHLSLAFRKLLRENSFRKATDPVLDILQAERQHWYLTAVRHKLILCILLPPPEVSCSLQNTFASWELQLSGVYSLKEVVLALQGGWICFFLFCCCLFLCLNSDVNSKQNNSNNEIQLKQWSLLLVFFGQCLAVKPSLEQEPS